MPPRIQQHNYQSINYAPPSAAFPSVHVAQRVGYGTNLYELRLFSIFRIPIYVHVTMVVYLVCGAILFAYSDRTLGLAAGALICGPILWCTVLIHELGHALCAKRLGGRADKILLWPLGGLAYCDCSEVTASSGSTDPVIPRAKARILVSIMGPATHIPMVAAWLGLVKFTTGMWFVDPRTIPIGENFWAVVAMHAVILNISLFVFNLLIPAYPLDGSQILVSSLMMCGRNPEQTAFIVYVISVPIFILLVLYGVYWLYFGQPQGLMTMFVAAWMFIQLQQLNEQRNNGLLWSHPLFQGYHQRTRTNGRFQQI